MAYLEVDPTFTKITTGSIVSDGGYSISCAWGDYDDDGFIDLFVANWGGGGINGGAFLYHNNRDGTFTRILSGPPLNNTTWLTSATWGDYDNDGFIDLYVTTAIRPRTMDVPNFLYHNNGNGTFTLVTNIAMAQELQSSTAGVWGDFNNDGWLDLCVGNFWGENNSLFHNNRDGTFTKITNSVVALDGGTTKGVAWADYDNDGWLDLFVSNVGPFDPLTGDYLGQEHNFLYHNNRDGTFTKITSGSLANDLGTCGGAVWGDYDNDGFLDLFVANGFFVMSANNLLYRNNGNSNSWLNLRLIGTVLNRSAIGAKVRVQATVGGKTFWQLREISGGSSFGSQNDQRANFGLGDATNADTMRIEWPSGIAQEFHDVAAKQFLTITEPSRLVATLSNMAPQFTLQGERGRQYDVQVSTDLKSWVRLSTIAITNLDGTALITDANPPNSDRRFYRVVLR